MKFGLKINSQFPVGADAVRGTREIVEQVRVAREAGFDSVWVSQHFLATPYQALQTRDKALVARAVDLPSGQNGTAQIQLHRHEEGTAALEKQIAQTGSATIYGIHFDTDSAKLRSDSLLALKAVLGLINNHPGSRWTIAGHTDNQGNASHNKTLSENRAASVITWLRQHAADSRRLEPQGFGPTHPVTDNATPNGRALNRRVEVTLAK